MTANHLAVGVSEGDVIAGKYRVEGVIGAGGMGVVIAAHHLALDERVAIKFLRPVETQDSLAPLRFAREARAAVKIKSQHVARVMDVGQMPNGAPFIVMEYLAGEDLASFLTKHKRLSVEQATDFILQACEALAAAHRIGIVHRDLKPGNLFVTAGPEGGPIIKVLDFGISHMDADVAITQTAAFVGSPLYMSPEQMSSLKDVDARGDIWSIGVILFEMLCGEPPFTGETIHDLVVKVLSSEARAPTELAPDVPAALSEIVLKCLQKDPQARYQSVLELAAALTPFAPDFPGYRLSSAGDGDVSSTYPSAGGASLPPVGPTQTGASWGATHSSQLRRRRELIGGGALVVLAGIGLLVYWLGTRNGQGVPMSSQSTPAAMSQSLPSAGSAPAASAADSGQPASPTGNTVRVDLVNADAAASGAPLARPTAGPQPKALAGSTRARQETGARPAGAGSSSLPVSQPSSTSPVPAGAVSSPLPVSQPSSTSPVHAFDDRK